MFVPTPKTKRHQSSALPSVAASKVPVPNTIEEAMLSKYWPYWEEAIQREYSGLMGHNTWEVTNCPKGVKPVGCKWIFSIKQNPDGSIHKFKARLVLQGFSQRAGRDYDPNDVFAPVLRHTMLLLLIAIAVIFKLNISDLDVSNAYLNAEMKEEVYMRQPPGLERKDKYGTPIPGLACLIKRCIYGAKQSAHHWNTTFTKALTDFGLKQSATDPCLFYSLTPGDLFYVGLYVDDTIAVWEHRDTWLRFISFMEARFKITYNERSTWCLGTSIDYHEDGILVHNERLILDTIEKFNMSDCNPVSTPADPSYIPTKDDCPEPGSKEAIEMESKPFRSLVGSLSYLSGCTRPDITYTVNRISRYAHNPGIAHWNAAKRVLRYLKGTSRHGIKFYYDRPPTLEGFCDADFAGCPDTRRSTTGFVYRLAGGPISWSAKRQTLCSESTSEAEYIALSSALNECKYLRHVIAELELTDALLAGPTPIWEDNTGAKSIAEHPKTLGRTKHIEIKHHRVRDAVFMKVITVPHIATSLQRADILTKALPPKTFIEHRDVLLATKRPAESKSGEAVRITLLPSAAPSTARPRALSPI